MDNSPMDNSQPKAKRDEQWSEKETKILIDVWERHLMKLKRRYLSTKEWQEVADAIHARYKNSERTGAQCRRRMDRIKKRYKTEKADIKYKIIAYSTWPLYSRVRYLKETKFYLKKLRVSNSGKEPRELAKAIERFTKVYERTEEAKSRMMVELEKQRMEFQTELVIQGMDMLKEFVLRLKKD